MVFQQEIESVSLLCYLSIKMSLFSVTQFFAFQLSLILTPLINNSAALNLVVRAQLNRHLQRLKSNAVYSYASLRECRDKYL